jgi:hypothetical protein
MGTGSFPGVKRPYRGADHPPHLASRLKKGYSYHSTPPRAFVACYRVEFTFTFTFRIRFNIQQFYILPTECIYVFLGAFAKLLKAVISFVTSKCPSCAPTGGIFIKFSILIFSEKSLKEVQVGYFS